MKSPSSSQPSTPGLSLTPLQKLQQNYVSATYIASRYGRAKTPSKDAKTIPQFQDLKKMQTLYRQQNQVLGNAIYHEKQHRKKIQKDFELFRLAYQQLETTNQKLTASRQSQKNSPTGTPMLSFCNQMSTSAGDLDLFKGVKKSLKNKRKKYAEAAVQTEIEQSSYVSMERSLERMRVEVEAVKGRAGREVQGLKEQVKGLMGRNQGLQAEVEGLVRQVEDNKVAMKKAMNRERNSVQNLIRFSQSLGIKQPKLQQFFKQGPATHQFQLGGIDKTTSEVFREHILYLMYLSSKQNQSHQLQIAQLKKQAQIDSQITETSKRDIVQCKQCVKQLTDLIIQSTTLTNAIKRECRKVAENVDKLGRG